MLEGTPLMRPSEIANLAARRTSSQPVQCGVAVPAALDRGCFNDVHNSHQCFNALLGQ
jgi:hypothetical protein